MKKEKIEIIKEVVDFLLISKYDMILGDRLDGIPNKLEYIRNNLTTYNPETGYIKFVNLTYDLSKTKEIDEKIIKLHSLLSSKDKIKEVVYLEEEMKKIQAKKYITVKEFTEIYNISKTSQADLRGRLNNSLPYHQKVSRGKIVYVVKEIEDWFANQYK